MRTPPPEAGILDGITRAKVMELCRENGIPLVERRISPDELRGADEAFITSATRGVLPVTTIDEKPVGRRHARTGHPQADRRSTTRSPGAA